MHVLPLLAMAALLGACATAPDPAPPRQILVLRHLEKAPGDDPPLTAAGAANAQALARGLAALPIASVHATPTRRTRQTAEPVARARGLRVEDYAAADADALVARVRAAPGHALVVGHSNTVPDLVERFGGARPGPIGEGEYGWIYRVVPSCGFSDRFRVGSALPPLPAACEGNRAAR